MCHCRGRWTSSTVFKYRRGSKRRKKFPDIKLYWDDNPRIIGKVVAAFTPIEIDFLFFSENSLVILL